MQIIERIKILLADDDDIDKELFAEAMDLTKIPYTIEMVANGKELLEYLETEGKTFPDFIFLDLNMPVMDGREALDQIKKSPRLRSIPVFILSTSNAHHDVANCYNAGANLYFVKPADFHELVEMQKNLLSLFRNTIAKPLQSW